MNTLNESVNHNDLIESFKNTDFEQMSDEEQQKFFKDKAVAHSHIKESWDERLERITKQFSSASYQQSILK